MGRTVPFISLETALAERQALREAFGLSVQDFKRAARLCEEDPSYAEDFLLALAWIGASSLAINVRGDRAAWNRAHALRRVEGMECPPGIAALGVSAAPGLT